MPLVKFDTTNMIPQRAGERTIRFSRKGASSISKTAAAVLGLEHESTIAVLQDGDTPEDWYLELNPEEGFVLRKPKDADSLAFNNAAMANAILDALGFDEHNSVAFRISEEPVQIDGVDYYAIITAKPIISK